MTSVDISGHNRAKYGFPLNPLWCSDMHFQTDSQSLHSRYEGWILGRWEVTLWQCSYQAECINLGRAPGPLSRLEVSTAQSEKVKHQQGSIGRSKEHRAKSWEGNFSPGLCWDDTKSSSLSKAKAGSAAISTVWWKETVLSSLISVEWMLSYLSCSLKECCKNHIEQLTEQSFGKYICQPG